MTGLFAVRGIADDLNEKCFARRCFGSGQLCVQCCHSERLSRDRGKPIKAFACYFYRELARPFWKLTNQRKTKCKHKCYTQGLGGIKWCNLCFLNYREVILFGATYIFLASSTSRPLAWRNVNSHGPVHHPYFCSLKMYKIDMVSPADWVSMLCIFSQNRKTCKNAGHLPPLLTWNCENLFSDNDCLASHICIVRGNVSDND